MRPKVLPPKFFRRPAPQVAPELLGKLLVRRKGHLVSRMMITEVEAYDGPNDLASHASRGQTKRNEVMFKAGGVWYVYLCYGTHWMLNIVTGEKDYPSAVLIRGACGVGRDSGLYAGPGKLTKHLKIDKSFNSQPANKKTGLWIEDRGIIKHRVSIKCLPRVGVAYAGPIWSQKKWRFLLDGKVEL